jgi:hypothetical protein
MKASFKINTLRGIFFRFTEERKLPLPHRTVFSQTQKIKNVCPKRRFQFVGRKKLQIENPYPFARKESAYFYAPFRSGPALFRYRRTKTGQSSSSLQKGEHFPLALSSNTTAGSKVKCGNFYN